MSKIISISNTFLRSTNPLWQSTRCAASATAETQTVKHIKHAPGPFAVPYLGSAPAMLMNKHFDPLKMHKYIFHAVEKYGPIFLLDAFGLKNVCVSDPSDIKKVFEATKDNPSRNGTMQSMLKVRAELTDDYFEGKFGILLQDGEEWWRVRKRAQGPMMKPKIVKSYLESHNQVTLEFLDIIAGLQKKHGEMPEDFQEEIYKWALESVALVALDKRLGCLNPNLSEDGIQLKLIKHANLMFEAMNETEFGMRLWRLFETKSYKQLKTSHQVFIDVADVGIRQTVEDLKNKPEDAEMTLMESLLQMPGLSYKDVVTMVLDMLFAGIDTTSHTVGFALYLLAKNPEKQRMAQQEIEEIFGDRQDFTAADFAKLSYMKHVLKETLRIYPLGLGVLRMLTEDLELRGYHIPKGYGVITMNIVPSRDDKYFPQAAEFIPERWSRSRPLGPIDPFISLPFGVGTRMCIGRRIAEQEMYVFLTRILQRFNVDYKHQDMEMKTKMVFAPSEPLRFSFTERK